MASSPDALLTPDAYLRAERRAATKHEYDDGLLRAMAGASREHNLIVGDTNASLIAALRPRRCETYTSDMRVAIPARAAYTYPDLVALCGEPEFTDAEVDTLLNPTLIAEVLSPSTEHHDRTRKLALYRAIPTLREYLLIAQDEYRIDYYRRTAEGQWFIGEATGRDAHLALAIGGGVSLALADIDARVVLPG